MPGILTNQSPVMLLLLTPSLKHVSSFILPETRTLDSSIPQALRPCTCALELFAEIKGGAEEHQYEEENAKGDFSEGDLGVAGMLLEDLSWRVERLRLEEANTRSFLKAKPRFLPYDECRKWVQAFNRWHSEDDWKTWIAMGEKRNAYIPSKPDEYYTRTGDWISWTHFLENLPREADDCDGTE